MSDYRKRVDANQAEIVSALRKNGYVVDLTHRIGGGFPDLLVTSKRGCICLLECKVGQEKLNSREIEWWESHPTTPKFIVRSVEEAVEAMGDFDEWTMEIGDV